MAVKKSNGGVAFSSLFTPDQIICQTECQDRDTILMDLLKQLAFQRGIGNVNQAYQAVIAQENITPAIAGPHIAIPHARLDYIDEVVVGIATSREGIQYSPDQSLPIKLIILILAPKASPGIYLQTLSSIARICQDPQTGKIVSELTNAKQVWKFFDSGGMVLPDYVTARDIMDPVVAKLNEDDTLEQAIDLFVRHRMRELPVVDKEDELIGVVTAYELLKVCLPDYILWMDDLTPIINFEPFAEILRKESQTWLAEIMTGNYAIVQETEPAIQVAKEITRQQTDFAYVVRNKQLIGVVSLVGFLHKVLRE